jgi:hypothetical protein
MESNDNSEDTIVSFLRLFSVHENVINTINSMGNAVFIISYLSCFNIIQRVAAMLRAAFVPLCLLIFTMFKYTISCLDNPDVRHAL